MKKGERVIRFLAQALGAATVLPNVIFFLVAWVEDDMGYRPGVWADSVWFLGAVILGVAAALLLVLWLAAKAVLRGSWGAALGTVAKGVGYGMLLGLVTIAVGTLLLWLTYLIQNPILMNQLAAIGWN